MRGFRSTLVFILTVCVASMLVVGCESGGGDDNDNDNGGNGGGGDNVDKPWLPYVGTWYGKGLREVWVNVAEDSGIVTVRDNVNPDAQTQPWNDSKAFEFSGGPTCRLEFYSADSATVYYTHNTYVMTKL